MKKITASLKKVAGRLVTLFPTFDYIDYQVGIRKHNKEAKTVSSLARNWKFTPNFLFTGRRLYFDLWIVGKKIPSYKPVIRYEWKLCFPDGKQVDDIGGTGVADMNINNFYKAVLGLGHFSIAGAYRIDLKVRNDVNSETLSEIIDFDVHSLGRIEFWVFLTCLLVLITLFFSVILRACGFPPG